MPGIPGADDDARYPGLVQHPADRDRTNSDAMTCRNRSESGEHLLKHTPAAELVDDQPVLHQRSILEGRWGILGPEIPIGQKTAGERAVAQEADAFARTLRGETARRAAVEH